MMNKLQSKIDDINAELDNKLNVMSDIILNKLNEKLEQKITNISESNYTNDKIDKLYKQLDEKINNRISNFNIELNDKVKNLENKFFSNEQSLVKSKQHIINDLPIEQQSNKQYYSDNLLPDIDDIITNKVNKKFKSLDDRVTKIEKKFDYITNITKNNSKFLNDNKLKDIIIDEKRKKSKVKQLILKHRVRK